MLYILSILGFLVSGICCGQQIKTEIENRNDTFFIKHLYATAVYETLPPQYDNYVVVRIDTLFAKDSLEIKQIQSRDLLIQRYGFPQRRILNNDTLYVYY